MTIKSIKIEKSSIALIQLRRSIQLHNIGDYISSITLAGAANEIFENLAKRKHGKTALDLDKSFSDGLAELLNKNKVSKDKIKQIDNGIKNQLKHNNSGENDEIEADYHHEAKCLIDSAIRNFWIFSDNRITDRIINKYVNAEWN